MAVDQALRSRCVYNVILEQQSIKHLKKKSKQCWSKINEKTYKPEKSFHVISRNLYIWNRYELKYAWKKDMLMLTMGQYSILNQLRSEHISLNWYYHALTHYVYYKNQILNRGHIKYIFHCNQDCCKKK
eukprot:203252_1